VPYFFYPTLSQAAEPKDPVIARIDSLFKYGEIDHAESEVLKILPDHNLNDEQRVQLEVLLGSILIAKNDTTGAYQAFQRALQLHPSLALNNVTTSPKIMVVFRSC